MQNLAGTSKNAPISLFARDGQGKSCGSYELSSWKKRCNFWLISGWFVGSLGGLWVICGWFDWFLGVLSVIWMVCGWFGWFVGCLEIYS